ncbi:MAG TPA: hypothetical protein VG898_01085 [Solirubrobacterales bacterium]|nr:hypothetical protein [Solirubrobacterales bacterium]
MSEQGHLVGFRPSQPAQPQQDAAQQDAAPQDAAEKTTVADGRRIFRLPLLRGRSAADAGTREERAALKQREKELRSVEAAEAAFFETPAGKARLAYKRGHRLFQYELATGELPPTQIPGPVGSPARETTDPVDILNSVTVEGWKLVTGKFIHSEVRGGVVGVYLFKRSQKRRLAMNDPWRAPQASASS